MNIEDLIKKRKDELDIETPPAELWDGIRKKWKQEPKGISWWKVAAVVFITTSVGLLIHNISLQNEVEHLASLGDISEKYRSIENDYISQVNSIESSIPIEQAKSQEDYTWIFEELKTLDEINTLYRKDIGKINEQQLVEVLMDYYEKKIRLLKKLELEIQRTNKFKNDEETNTNSVSL
ncbi:MAG: hypothetical protein RLN88_06320 [Ekhidna sp.]|uniref:hypothetical protein n=1 Tax=Ekhidna sp. TaxID=2608089 RepID=UPI0032EE0C93